MNAAVAIRRLTGSALTAVLALLVLTSAAGAEYPDMCSQYWAVTHSSWDALLSLAVVEHLEEAWNAGDSTAAMALFADDAVAASSSGMAWRGNTEISGFLSQLWDPAQSGAPVRIETQSRCAVEDRIEWQFRYQPAEGTGTADVVVHGGRITYMFWTFTPRAVPPPGVGVDELRLNAARTPGAVVGAVVPGFILLLTTGGLLLSRARGVERTGRKARSVISELHQVMAEHRRR